MKMGLAPGQTPLVMGVVVTFMVAQVWRLMA